MTSDLSRCLQPRSIAELRQVAADAAASRYFPVKSVEEAFVILMTGAELGLQPMQAMRGIYVVNGKPVLSADMLVAAVRASGACESWRVVVSTAERCEIRTRRKGESEDEIGVWTRADAERAGVYRKPGPWQQYPDRMLRHRCASDLARRVYPDVCLGVYVPGELDDDSESPSLPVRSTPLDLFADDLTSAETPESIRVVYRTYAAQLAELDDDGAAIRAARDAIHERCVSLGFTRTKAETDRLLGKGQPPAPIVDVSSDHEVVRALRECLRAASSTDDVLARWREASASIKALSDEDQRDAWLAACARWAEIAGCGLKDAAKALRAALRGPDGDGPKGGKKPVPALQAAAQGAAEPAAPAAGATAHADSAQYVASADAWAARCATYPHRNACENSWLKHGPAFRAAGVDAARLRVLVQRLVALGIDEAHAERLLLNAELIAARRSPIAARRALRDAQERSSALITAVANGAFREVA